ncbi:hypothetical protein KIM372_10920 [Bombiscardovia nodaiensis]|uniref:Sugar ABC transporter substrate-binding protein n=1 Tax=Bombiscardovia nodaiensis TaxID=2932181 RepID=A0ABN6SE54_9BIFI|nr:hypothetical protein KIM372_10920 [Bombiscardovia nodaiensis]
MGDSWQQGVTSEHDGVDRSNVQVALVGPASSSQRQAQDPENTVMFDLLEHNNMQAYYAPASSQAGQEQAVRDAVARKVSVVVVENMSPGPWTATLEQARKAGVALTLLGPGYRPQQQTLYAAELVLDQQAPDAQPLGRVLQTIVDDRAHARTIRVNLSDDMAQHKWPDQMEEKL